MMMDDKRKQWAKMKAERHAKRFSKPQKYGPKGWLTLHREAMQRLFGGADAARTGETR